MINKEESGYDPKLFKSEPHESIHCTICQLVLRDPVQCLEGHLFCQCCLENWRLRSSECPCCRGDISGKLAKNRYVASQISAMEVSCLTNLNIPGGNIERSERCNFQGSLSSMHAHLHGCPFVTEKCPNAIYIHSGDLVQGCPEIIQRRNMETHTGQCEHRLVCCELCNEEVRKFQLDLHRLQMCLMRPTACPNEGCVDMVAFSKLNEHRDNCGFELLSCSLFTIDPEACRPCTGFVRRVDVESHMYSVKTLFSAILMLNSKLEKTNSKLERTTACLERTNNNLEKTIKKLEKTTNELERTKRKLEQKTGDEQKIEAEIVVGSQVRIRNVTENVARMIFSKAAPGTSLNYMMVQQLGKNGIVIEISYGNSTLVKVNVEGSNWYWPLGMLEAK